MADDAGLLDAWRVRRDGEAFRILCERHAGLVAATCRRLGAPDPDEATQAVFLVLARAGAIPGDRLAGWLVVTAGRIVGHQRRAAARRRRHEQEAATDLSRQESSASDDPAWDAARAHLDAALASLSPARREAVLRFHLQGKSQATVATELGCSVAAVKTRVHEGIERMRAFLARRGLPLGAAALASGLAAEAAAAEPALADACMQNALAPSAPPAIHTLAQGIVTDMLIRTSALCAAIAVVVAGAVWIAAAEPLAPIAAGAPAEVAVGTPDPNANAALDWWRAINVLDDDNDLRPLLALDPLKAALPDPRVDAAFAPRCRPLDMLALGAANGYCDWGIDLRHEGSEALIPYVVKLPKLIGLALLRARWHAAGARAGDAVTDLLTAQRATRLSVGRAPCLIDILAANRMEEQVITTIGMLLPGLPDAERLRLHAGCEALPPSTVADAIASEVGMVAWMVDQLLAMPLAKRPDLCVMQADRGDAKLMAEVLPTLDDGHLRDLPRIFAAEAAQWEQWLRLPPDERRDDWKPWSGGRSPHYLLDRMTPNIPALRRQETRLTRRRQQLRAAIAILADGDGALARHPDPITGAPFRLERTAAGFRLAGEPARNAMPIILEVGCAPTAPAPAETQPQEAAGF